MKVSYFIKIMIFNVFLSSCRSGRQEESALRNILRIEQKIESNTISLKINKIIPVNGLVYDFPGHYYIEMKPKNVTVRIPSFYFDESKLSDDLLIESQDFDYKLQKESEHVYVINLVIPYDKKKYDFSILITAFGESTVYLKEGNYRSISFLGKIE